MINAHRYVLLSYICLAVSACGSTTKTSTPTVSVNPEAFVFPKVTLAPDDEPPVVEVRIVEVANTGTGELVLTNIALTDNSSDGEFTLRLADDDNELAAVGNELRVQGGQAVRLAVEYTPGDEDASDTGSVTFDTNDPSNSTVVIPISVREDSAELRIMPKSLDFGRIGIGESKSLELTLINSGGFELEIRNLTITGSTGFSMRLDGEELPDDGLENTLTVAPDDSVVITVTFSPASANRAEGLLNIESNSRLNRLATVPLRANGAVACLRVSPDFLDFGSGLLTEDREGDTQNRKSLILESCGSSSLQIERIEFEDGEAFFDVLDRPVQADGEPLFNLPAASEDEGNFPSEQVTIGFWPSEVKAYGGRLKVTSSSPQSPHYVDLFGRGVDNQCPIPVVTETEYNVPPLDVITLDGTPSMDPDGGPIREYHWVVVDRPMGSVSVPVEEFTDPSRPADGGTPDDITTSRARFFVDLAGRYTIELRVVDELGTSSCPPLAVATLQIESIPDKDLHVQLVWTTPEDPDETDKSGTDVDLHLRHERAADAWSAAAGQWDCFFENKNPDWGEQGSVVDNPVLDIDDRNGAGPENINLSDPEIGVTYDVGVIYFRSNTAFGVDGRELADYPSFATVRVYAKGELLDELVNKKLTESYQLWHAVQIRWCEDAADTRRCPVITTVDRLYSKDEYRSGPTGGN